MEVKAKAKHIKISPRKVRLVLDIIRGLKVEEALNQLKFNAKQAARPVIKLLESAIANAENNFELEKSNLYIREVRADEGQTLKRWSPRARGRATPIRKRTSHITLVLGELVESGKTAPKKQKLEAPIKLGEKAKEVEGVKIKDGKGGSKADSAGKDESEKGKKIVDPRGDGRGKNTKIEGNQKGSFTSKVFRRKSG